MSKGDVSCAMGLGSDGTGGGNAFWGKILAMALSGVRINPQRFSVGPGEGHLGKIG
jgi:hypothetical protein